MYGKHYWIEILSDLIIDNISLPSLLVTIIGLIILGIIVSIPVYLADKVVAGESHVRGSNGCHAWVPSSKL